MIGSVRGRRTFDELRRNGLRARSGAVRMSYLQVADEPDPRIAFALSKRFGNAVDRNRGRRRLKAAFTDAWHQADPRPEPGCFLLTGTRRILTDDFQRLVGDVERCLGLVESTRIPRRDDGR